MRSDLLTSPTRAAHWHAANADLRSGARAPYCCADHAAHVDRVHAYLEAWNIPAETVDRVRAEQHIGWIPAAEIVIAADLEIAGWAPIDFTVAPPDPTDADRQHEAWLRDRFGVPGGS